MNGTVNVAAGERLARLVAPFEPRLFFEHIWERRAAFLHAPGRSWDHLGVAVETVLRAVERAEVTARIVVTEDGDDRVSAARGAIALPLPEGSTLCVNNIERAFPEVDALCRDVLSGFGMASHALCNLYYSAEGHGFAGHFDTQAVFVVQLAGKKIWRYGSAPDVPWPPLGCADTPRAIAEFRAEHPDVPMVGPAYTEEGLLEPGDVLYLPAGTWHRARASEGTSLALAVTVLPANAWEIITRAIEPRLRGELAWRRDVGAPIDAPPDRLPATVEAHLMERVESLRAALASVTPADLHRVWRLHRGGASRARWEGDVIHEDDVLSHAGGLAPGYQRDGDSLRLLYTGCEVELDVAAEPFVRALVAHGRFRAGDAVHWAPDLMWDEVSELLRTLLREGVLSVAPRGAR